jgi:hypothetical protein
MRITLTAALSVVIVVTAAAQAKPDLSGSWTNARTDASDWTNLEGVVGMKSMVITQSASSLRIERTYGENTATILLPLDGSKATYTLDPGNTEHVGTRVPSPLSTPRTLESRVQWKDDKLVITTERRLLEIRTLTTETLSLRGNELIVERDVMAGPVGGPSRREGLPPLATYTRVVKLD